MNNVLFDTSAILALINNEMGKGIAEKFLGRISVSSVNLGEFYGKLMDYGIEEGECIEIAESVINKVIDFDEELSLRTASLRVLTKDQGLSLGDRACIATGIHYDLAIYTADKSWSKLDLGCKIIQIR